MINLKTLIIKSYLPAALYEIAIGAISPMVAIAALNLKADITTASIIAAMLGIGQIIGDIPAGKLATSHGDRRAMIYGAGASLICLVICYFASNYYILSLGVLTIGAINAIFMLARQGYIIEITPPKLVSRALSGLGGMSRIGLLVGPFLGSWVISVWGFNSLYILSIIIVLLSLTVLLVFPDDNLTDYAELEAIKSSQNKVSQIKLNQIKSNQVNISSVKLFKQYRKIFLTLGFAILLVSVIRAIRQVGIPLWAQSQGISDDGTSLIFGLSSLFDVALFYPSALLMDKWGRLWSSVPSMLIMAVGLAILPLTHSFWAITIVAMVIGIGNGLGTGIVMTLAADIAPSEHRANFLGIWRIYSDFGNAVGPALISLGTTVLTLGMTISLLSSLGLIAAVMLLIFAPKFSNKANLLGIPTL
ncbi:MAG: MFS transporter [Bifidobacteriaceae bacterium]|nr:MFS transporter [Bifidobacteriaceae bacterium]